MKHLADDCLHFGSLHYDQWLAAYEGLRVAAARLIGADPVRDRPREEHLRRHRHRGHGPRLEARRPHRGLPRGVSRQSTSPGSGWKQKGVAVTWLSVTTPWNGSTKPAAGPGCWPSASCSSSRGYRAPIQAIGEICHRNHCIYFVDAIQGLGAFPIDVRASHIDALAADGHKWLTGPEGCGHALHQPSPSGSGGTRRIRLDQRGQVQRLRFPRYVPPPGRGTVRMRNSKYHWMLWITGSN